MKNKGLILGVLLIIGIFLMGPISAAKVIDKGHKTVYSSKYDCEGYYSWETHKISKYHVNVYMNVYYENGKIHKLKMVLQNVKPHKIKITNYVNVNGKKTKSIKKYKSYGYTALQFYNIIKYDLHNIDN